MGVSAWAKTLIDRCQCYWAKKYILKQPAPSYHGDVERRGVFISTAGSNVKQAFDGAKFTMKYFFDAVGVKYYKDLLYPGIDEKGAIKKHPTALKEAYDTGRDLIR